MLSPMQPDTGGRFSLQLEAHDATRAAYALTLSTRLAEWSARAEVAAVDGRVEHGAWQGEGEPPAWLLQYARAALRSAWHAHRDQGWPRRLTRWRDMPIRSDAARESREE
jgi:hypothetical protein